MAENKYGDPQGVEQTMYNKDYKIQLLHLPSGQQVEFKAFLTQFEDQFTSDWNTEQVRRMDPIKNYRGTQRIITLGWDVVANGLEEAVFNLNNCSLLLSMLYPSFDDDSTDNKATTEAGTKQRTAAQQSATEPKQEQATTVNGNATRIQGAPLFKLKFANLIQSTNASGAPGTILDGLVGSIDGLTYSPDVEQGFFDPDPGILYPQTIRLSFGFTVAHDHALGWRQGGTPSQPTPLRGNVVHSRIKR